MSQLPPAGRFVLGVDVGGTKVAAGLVDAQGTMWSHARSAMICNRGPEEGLNSVIAAIETVVGKLEGRPSVVIPSIGICSPGPLDQATGVVLNPPNLPCWRNFPLASELASRYQLPVKLDNDANAAGLAEAMWGAGKGYRNVFYFTIGTGIGTAVVLDGKIYHGRTGAAAEGGHMSIDIDGPRCGCGKPGCIEALASGPAIARRARSQLENGRDSALRALAGGKVEDVTCEMVAAAHVSGDALATEVIQETARLLAFWLGNVVDLLEPDVMIVGGGVASVLQSFFPLIAQLLPEFSVNSRSAEIPLLPAHYGEDAGIAGAAALWF